MNGLDIIGSQKESTVKWTNYTGSSYISIYHNYTETRTGSGYYQITSEPTVIWQKFVITSHNTPICAAAGVGGGWRRIVDTDICVGDDCFIGWTKDISLVTASAEDHLMVWVVHLQHLGYQKVTQITFKHTHTHTLADSYVAM